MKIIRIDNMGRETIPEHLIADNLTLCEAKAMLEDLRRRRPDGEDWWYILAKDEYRLWRGMEDVV